MGELRTVKTWLVRNYVIKDIDDDFPLNAQQRKTYRHLNLLRVDATVAKERSLNATS